MERKIVDISVGGVDHRDYPDFCDAYIEEAYWADTGEALTDEEIDEFIDPSIIHELAMESLY